LFLLGLIRNLQHIIAASSSLSDSTTAEKALARMRQRLLPDSVGAQVLKDLDIHITVPNAPSPDFREELMIL